MPDYTPVRTAEKRRYLGVATPMPPSSKPIAGPALKNSKTVRNQTVAKANGPGGKKTNNKGNGGNRGRGKSPVIKTPVAPKPVYAVSPLPLDSTQIEQIDMMRRAANEAILAARAGYDEGVATTELENQMAAQALRRQTAMAAQDAAARTGARGVGLSPAVLQRAAADLQARSDAGFAELSRTRTSRLADLNRQLQRAKGEYDTEMNLADRLAARYGANPRGLMGVG